MFLVNLGTPMETASLQAIDKPTALVSSPEVLFASGKAMARGLASHWPASDRLDLARCFCRELIHAYWECEWHRGGRQGFPLSSAPITKGALNASETALASDIARQLSNFSAAEASYLAGTIYTALLPADVRSRLGAYYTPPSVVDRLLDRATDAGHDWATGTVLDPACGGGAFLAPVALRIVNAMGRTEPAFILANLSRKLVGLEIDPFAAWMSQSILEITLIDLAAKAGKPVPQLVRVGDSLDADIDEAFDLVIGNPPYGRTRLTHPQRIRFARSLYGHANLYSVFTDLGIRWTKAGGILAYITPTSFLGGQYFRALRHVIVSQAEAFSFDFLADREGVFDDVLQETLLAVYRKQPQVSIEGEISLLSARGISAARVESLGRIELPQSGEDVWIVPRTRRDVALVSKLRRMPTRLADLGYSVSTGPLVWNRHKDQLEQAKIDAGCFPIIWAECAKGGTFLFRHDRSNHAPFIRLSARQKSLLLRNPAVICQRTTSKEQTRRLVAAVLPKEFLSVHGGAVVENHVNVLTPSVGSIISPETVSSLLNSQAADRAFRCISGSVAVSASELAALPVPSMWQMLELEGLVRGKASLRTIEATIDEFYGE